MASQPQIPQRVNTLQTLCPVVKEHPRIRDIDIHLGDPFPPAVRPRSVSFYRKRGEHYYRTGGGHVGVWLQPTSRAVMSIDVDVFHSANDFSERGQAELMKAWQDYYDRLPDSPTKRRLHASVSATVFSCLVLRRDRDEWKERLSKVLTRQRTFVPHWKSSPRLRRLAQRRRRRAAVAAQPVKGEQR